MTIGLPASSYELDRHHYYTGETVAYYRLRVCGKYGDWQVTTNHAGDTDELYSGLDVGDLRQHPFVDFELPWGDDSRPVSIGELSAVIKEFCDDD